MRGYKQPGVILCSAGRLSLGAAVHMHTRMIIADIGACMGKQHSNYFYARFLSAVNRAVSATGA